MITDGLVDQMKIELYLLVKSNVKIKAGNFSKYVLEKFRREFEHTESGVRRNWMKLEDEKIEEIYKASREATLEVIQAAKTAFFPEMLTGMM
jgi:hypothetical protein